MADEAIDLPSSINAVGLAEQKRQEILSSFEAAYGRAEQALKNGMFGEASGICNDILESLPDTPEPLAILGKIAHHRGQVHEALFLMGRALQVKPGVADWHLTMCRLYQQAKLPEQAVAHGNAAMGFDHSSPDALVELARSYGLLLGAKEAYDKIVRHLLGALAINPRFPEARMAMAELFLSRGELQIGFREYEWRLKTDFVSSSLPTFRSSEWNGMKIPDGRIVVWAEGGYGDTIQFTRYLPRVAERCSEVILCCPPDLELLIPHSATVCTDIFKVPPHAAHITAMSLPYVLNVSSYDDIRTTPPTRIQVSDEAFRSAKRWLPSDRKAGICWAGRKSHKFDALRSMPLSTLRPLMNIKSLALVSLQKEVPGSDEHELNSFWTELYQKNLDVWHDTAAIIKNLDVVVTVDTAVAHLAGSLGVRTLLMLANLTDWRWFKDLEDTTPWYANVELFRQNAVGANWQDVVKRVCGRLRELLQK